MDKWFNWWQIAAVEHRHRRRSVLTSAACRRPRRLCLVVGYSRAVARPRVGVEQAAPGAVLAGRGDVGPTPPQTGVDVGEQAVSFGTDVDELFVVWKLHSPDTLGVRPDSLDRQPVTRFHWLSLQNKHLLTLFSALDIDFQMHWWKATVSLLRQYFPNKRLQYNMCNIMQWGSLESGGIGIKQRRHAYSLYSKITSMLHWPYVSHS